MDEHQPARPSPRGGPGTALIGGVLIILGALFFGAEQLNIDLARAGWPFYVIAPGVALAAWGLSQRDGSGLTVAGSVITIVGLVLLYQNTFDHYESWAYAWALVGPGGSGVGMLLYGTRSANPKMARDGFRQILVAAGLFVAGFVFFEGIIGISGDRFPLPGWVMPVAIILLGVAVLARGLMTRRQPGEWASMPAPDDTVDEI